MINFLGYVFIIEQLLSLNFLFCCISFHSLFLITVLKNERLQPQEGGECDQFPKTSVT